MLETVFYYLGGVAVLCCAFAWIDDLRDRSRIINGTDKKRKR